MKPFLKMGRNTRKPKNRKSNIRSIVTKAERELKNIKQRKRTYGGSRRRNRIGNKMPNTTSHKSAPVAKGFNTTYSKPKYESNGSTITITHSEYLGTINASDPFAATKFRLNPTDANTFPWLSTLANAYEKWKIKGLRARTVANCATITYGKTFMYFDYNPNNAPVTNIGIVLNTMDAVSGTPWVDKQIRYKPGYEAPKQFLIRSPYEAYNDYILYDPANLYVGTIGSVAGNLDPVQDLCEIWLDYKIELSVPDPSNGLRFNNSLFKLTDVQSIANGGGYAPDLQTSNTQIVAGNFMPTLTHSGFSFTDEFVGAMMIQMDCANGFDASRHFNMAGTGGAQLFQTMSVLNDETVSGDDQWAVFYQVNCPTGSSINFSGPLTTSAVTYTFTCFAFYPCNPLYWEFPSSELLNSQVALSNEKKSVKLDKHKSTVDDEEEFELFLYNRYLEKKQKSKNYQIRDFKKSHPIEISSNELSEDEDDEPLTLRPHWHYDGLEDVCPQPNLPGVRVMRK